MKQEHRCLLKNLKWSLRKIAKKLKISLGAVTRTVDRKAKTGTNKTATRSGAPRKTTKRENRFIVTHSKRNRKLTAREIAAELNRIRVESVSSRTVARRLCDASFRGRVAVRKPLLREVNVTKRLKWAKEHKNWTVDQ